MRSTTMLRCALAAAVLLLAGAAQYQAIPPAAAAPAAHLRLTGSSTMGPLMTEVARRFQRHHPRIRVDVEMGGSGRGLSDVRQGRADIGMVSRALADGENDLYGIPIARDGVAVVVHRDNPLAALQREQLAGIYTGKITNWRQLGGADGPLRLLAGHANGGSTAQLTHYLGLPYTAFAAPRGIDGNAERIRAVAADPLAIVYASLGQAERQLQAGLPIKLLALDGVAASSANIRNASYPMARPLTLVSRNVPAGAARQFTQFCATSQISDLVLAHDFVPYLD